MVDSSLLLFISQCTWVCENCASTPLTLGLWICKFKIKLDGTKLWIQLNGTTPNGTQQYSYGTCCKWNKRNSGIHLRHDIFEYTVYPKKYAHGFVVLCFVVVMLSFIMNSHELFIHIHQGCFAGTGAIVRLPRCQWSKPDGYGKISQCITTTKHSKAKTVCIFLGIYCTYLLFPIGEYY